MLVRDGVIVVDLFSKVGDVVLARRGGAIFIPPHFAQQVVERDEEGALRDRFGYQRLREGVYTLGKIDHKWAEEIGAGFAKWRENQKERNTKKTQRVRIGKP